MERRYLTPEIENRWRMCLRVKLTQDLTSHPALTAGAEGIVLEFRSWLGDDHWQVDFLTAGSQNVHHTVLEPLDEGFARDLELAQTERLTEILHRAHEAVLYVGRDGAYRAFHVWDKKGQSDQAVNQHEANKLIHLLKQRSVPIAREVWR